MKDVRFYQDFGTKKAKRAYWDSSKLAVAPNCLALFVHNNGGNEGFVAITDRHDSHVSVSSVSTEYLRKHCVRCSEEVARMIHPNLFKRMDAAPKEKAQNRKVQS